MATTCKSLRKYWLMLVIWSTSLTSSLHACTIWFDFKLRFSWNDLILITTFTQLDYIMMIVLNYIFPNSTNDIGDLNIKFILLL